MRTLEKQTRISALLSRFVTQVKGCTAMSRTDINLASENVLIPLLRNVYGLHNLKNLNIAEGANYPGIDLGDEEARVAFQITSTSDSAKVKHTLEKVVAHRLYENYDRVVVYILTEKQRSYSARPFDDITAGIPTYITGFSFDKDRDILDYTNLLSEITHLPMDRISRIEALLEENFGDGVPAMLGEEESVPDTESVFLNLLELSFPDKLFVADLALDTDESEEEEWTGKRPRYGRSSKPRRKNATAQVRDALNARGLKFGVDWICHAKQIVTFHDLRDSSLSLTNIIDRGTAEWIRPEEFYGADENYERVFKTLLGKCLQQKLFRRDVRWQHEDKLFIFGEVDAQLKRKEEWVGKKKTTRSVFERTMKNNKPDETLICKHLAFHTQYQRYGSQWYLVITPDWFFSYDGYARSKFGDEKIAWLKKKENNTQVFNHVRFITHFLKNDTPSNLFEHTEPYPFLKFYDLARFDNAPNLNDKDWLPGESEEAKKRLQQSDEDATASLEFDEE